MNVFYGKRNDGRPWHSVIIRGGGMGASSINDGNYVYIFPANGANTPVEIFESDTPLIVEKRELLADSGGPGRMKGGLGKREVVSEYLMISMPLFRLLIWECRREGISILRKGSSAANREPRPSSW